MMQRKLFTLFLLVSFYSSITAQEFLITGTVKDESKEPLIGAGIIGLVIILSAFLIVNFVVTNVSNALGEGVVDGG